MLQLVKKKNSINFKLITLPVEQADVFEFDKEYV